MARFSIQVDAIDTFTSHQFKKIFGGGIKNGSITTQNNQRTYHISWDKSTDTISVKRDMTNVSGWTKISEVFERWSRLDFTTNSEKWENRLTIQQRNVALAQPLKTDVETLLNAIEDIDTVIEPTNFPSKTIEDHLTQITSPISQLLQEKKQSLYAQARQISYEINENLVSHQPWTQQQNIQYSIAGLQEQRQQLDNFIEGIKRTMGGYRTIMGYIDVSKSPLIYDSLLTRLVAVGINMRQMIETYFDAGGVVPEAEVQSYNKMIRTEKGIARAFTHDWSTTHLAYNELMSPPSYRKSESEDAHSQDQVEFYYQAHLFSFSNNLVDDTKTFGEIQNAAGDLKTTKDRWQEQIHLEEEVSNVLNQLDGSSDKQRDYPVFKKHLKQMQTLKKKIHNNGNLLDLIQFESRQAQYKNIKRANTLYLEIKQFLKSLPGFVAPGRSSNYNDEMQSRILHLIILKNICKKELSLTSHALDHMERHVTAHKNVIQNWSDGEAFSRFRFYDPISNKLDYPAWLAHENRLFHQKTKEILKTQWETQYQLLKNKGLIKERGELIEKLHVKTESLVKASERFVNAAQMLRDGRSLLAMISHLFGFTFQPTSRTSVTTSAAQ